MASLLPPNAAALERAIETAINGTIDAVPVPVRDLWNPERCPVALLPWLAWALFIDEWDSQWPEDVKRTVLKQAIATHRLKGTIGAVKRVLETVVAHTEITEWFEPDSGLSPHTFQLVLWANATLAPNGGAVLGPELYRSLKRLIDSVKPVRSHYDIRVGAAFSTENHIQLAAISRPVTLVQVTMEAA